MLFWTKLHIFLSAVCVYHSLTVVKLCLYIYFLFCAKLEATAQPPNQSSEHFLTPQKSSQHFLDSHFFPTLLSRIVLLLGFQVGYGDLVPTNDLERAIACLTMVCGTTMFSYVIGSVSTLVM